MLITNAGLERLKKDEGFRRLPYYDKTGEPLLASPDGNITIGYGTNISAGLSEAEAEWLLLNRLEQSQEKLERTYAAIDHWHPIQIDVLLMIDYNTRGGVLKWNKLITSIITDAPWVRIANNVRDSLAWRSSATHGRYERMAQAIENGAWDYGEQGNE